MVSCLLVVIGPKVKNDNKKKERKEKNWEEEFKIKYTSK